jgi:U4/U6.U5 tri-snRNP-associated protein 1
MMAWVNKSRKIEEKRRKEERRKAEELARKLAEQDDEAEESEGDDIYGGKDLAGLRVRHGLEEVNEGETMILTLKDSSILDDKLQGINEEEDELENVNVAQEHKRQKARKAATKRSDNPFGADEDDTGKKILAKYDEDDDDDDDGAHARRGRDDRRGGGEEEGGHQAQARRVTIRGVRQRRRRHG